MHEDVFFEGFIDDQSHVYLILQCVLCYQYLHREFGWEFGKTKIASCRPVLIRLNKKIKLKQKCLIEILMIRRTRNSVTQVVFGTAKRPSTFTASWICLRPYLRAAIVREKHYSFNKSAPLGFTFDDFDDNFYFVIFLCKLSFWKCNKVCHLSLAGVDLHVACSVKFVWSCMLVNVFSFLQAIAVYRVHDSFGF